MGKIPRGRTKRPPRAYSSRPGGRLPAELQKLAQDFVREWYQAGRPKLDPVFHAAVWRAAHPWLP